MEEIIAAIYGEEGKTGQGEQEQVVQEPENIEEVAS